MSDALPAQPSDGPISVHPLPLQQSSSSSNLPQTHDWEAKARSWLSSELMHRAPTIDEMDGWIDSDPSSLPDGLKSLPRSHLHSRILSIHNIVLQSYQEGGTKQVEPPFPRFQRTDLWTPVYSWLESLETNDVVTSDQIVDWLSKNPQVKEQLSAKYSRHHLKHYIRRCHLKMLRRREKSKKAKQSIQVMQPPTTSMPMKVNNAQTALAVHHPCNISSYSLQDCDLSLSKRKEASLKYELLTSLQNQLTSLLSKEKQANGVKESASPSFMGQRPAENANFQLLNVCSEDGNAKLMSRGASLSQDTENFSSGGQSMVRLPVVSKRGRKRKRSIGLVTPALSYSEVSASRQPSQIGGTPQ